MELLQTLYNLRPLILFSIEITLCYFILKSNSRIKIPAFFLVLFLALYQLGEVLIIFTPSTFANLFAFTATSLIPITALLLLEKVKYNSIRFTPILYFIPFSYILYTIFTPEVFVPLSIDYCFVKYGNLIATNTVFFTWSMYYYIPFLFLGLLLSIVGTIYETNTKNKKLFFLMSISYILTVPSSFLVAALLNHSSLYIVSTMCSLAIFTAIFTYLMVKQSNLDTKEEKEKKEEKNKKKINKEINKIVNE
ncbi:MAG: hypothetical protein LAT82_05510 [Nanoarchaeota archaeon]|nr:hypothetical protein [Nanoarchaeota archaeon]